MYAPARTPTSPSGKSPAVGFLFHELVHVEQYRQLGVPRFSELYVRGFLSGGRYRNGQFDQFLVPEVSATTPNAPIGFYRQVNHC